MKLRQMERDDLEFVNNTRNHITTRLHLENNNEITLVDTVHWFNTVKPVWYIIEVNNDKVGYLRTSSDSGDTICIGCDIHPKHRRKGYASKAYKLLIKSLYDKGYAVIWLKVFRNNIPAYNLYNSLNFFEIGSKMVNEKEYITMVHRVIK